MKNTIIKILLAIILIFALSLHMCVSLFAEGEDDGGISDDTVIDSEENGGEDNDDEVFEDNKENSAWLSLDEGIRPGVEFTVIIVVNTPASFAFNGVFSYNEQLLELVDVRCLLDNWSCSNTVSDGDITFLAVDTLLSCAAEGEKELLELTFKTTGQADQGSLLEFVCGDISATDGQSDSILTGGSLNAAVGRSLSSEAVLRSISGNFTLSPEFSSEVHSYSTTVSGETESFEADLEYDEFAKVEISSEPLSIGENTVVITVVSEDGAQSSEYVIKVTREYPADYIYDTDSSIASVTLSSGTLSPEFDPLVKEYKLYVTEQTAVLTVNAVASSPLATVQPIEINVTEGARHTLVCVAEDGSVSEYVMTLCYINESREDEEQSSGKEPVDDDEKQAKAPSPYLNTVVMIIGLVLIATAFFFGFILAFAVKGRKKKDAEARSQAEGEQSDNEGKC